MDPCTTLREIDRAMACGDRASIAEFCGALIGWLEKGGFMPVGPHGGDWRGSLSPQQLCSVLRSMRAIAEMV